MLKNKCKWEEPFSQFSGENVNWYKISNTFERDGILNNFNIVKKKKNSVVLNWFYPTWTNIFFTRTGDLHLSKGVYKPYLIRHGSISILDKSKIITSVLNTLFQNIRLMIKIWHRRTIYCKYLKHIWTCTEIIGE